jgi:hypothetical protein
MLNYTHNEWRILPEVDRFQSPLLAAVVTYYRAHLEEQSLRFWWKDSTKRIESETTLEMSGEDGIKTQNG